LDGSASTSATEEREEFLDLEEELDRDRPDPLRELDLLDETPCIILESVFAGSIDSSAILVNFLRKTIKRRSTMDNYHIECQFFTAKMYQPIRNKKWHYQLAFKFASDLGKILR
jgi:hypothetical protein